MKEKGVTEMDKDTKGKFYDWMDENDDPENIFNPPMDAQTAVDLLKDYLLGEDWYNVDPVSTEQINTEIVYEILMKYSHKFRKEFRKLKRDHDRELKSTESFIHKIFRR
jgi:hypothetical protein